MSGQLAQITAETLEIIRPEMKRALSTGIDVGLGLQGFELEAPSKKLFPVLSPFRNSIPRVKAAVGSMAAHWKAITKINANRVKPSVPFGQAGRKVTTETKEFLAAYKVVAEDDTIVMDAQMLAQNFEDLRATGGINLLYSVMIDEDIELLGGQAFALKKPATPVLAAAGTGGEIDNGDGATVYVAVTARSLWGYYFGGQSIRSDVASVAAVAATTGKVTATVADVPGAVAYDWYVFQKTGALGGSDPIYAGTTTVNKIVITDTQDVADVSGEAADPAAWDTVVADTSADPDAFNGLLATISGEFLEGAFVTPGTAQAEPNGSIRKSLNGGQLTPESGAVQEIDDILLELWNTSRISPTRILVNARQHIDVTNGVLQSSGGGGGYILFRPDQAGERSNLVGGALLAQYLNKAVNGRPIPIETQPHIPDGTIVLISEVLPYPNNAVSNVFEVETQQEYTQLEYAMSRAEGAQGGPRYDLEVRAIETFKNYFPAGCAVLSNVAPGLPS